MSDTATTPSTATGMWIDRYLPRFDVSLSEHMVVAADVPTTWLALRDLDLMRIHTPLLDAAVFLRGLPGAAARQPRQRLPRARRPAWPAAAQSGYGPTVQPRSRR